jgi:hypothetical protein
MDKLDRMLWKTRRDRDKARGTSASNEQAIYFLVELALLSGLRCPPISKASSCPFRAELVEKMSLDERLELNGECYTCWLAYISTRVVGTSIKLNSTGVKFDTKGLVVVK